MQVRAYHGDQVPQVGNYHKYYGVRVGTALPPESPRTQLRRCHVQDMPKHRSNAETLIADVPPIEVDGNMAVCEGGALAWGAALPCACPTHASLARRGAGGGENGHPAEWIQLDTRDGRLPAVCKYCGLRYIKKAGDDKAKAATKAALVANTFP